jgi:hypothetical protein
MRRAFIPLEVEYKDLGFSMIITTLADSELKSKKPNIMNILNTLNDWPASEIEQRFYLDNSRSVKLTKEDITEILVNSGIPGENRQEMMRLFVIKELLDSIIYRHNQVYSINEYGDTGTLGVDEYLKDGKLYYITSKLNARGYLYLLGQDNIRLFLNKNGCMNVADYVQRNGERLNENRNNK